MSFPALWLALAAVLTVCSARSAFAGADGQEPNPFAKSYLNVELTRNFPQSFAQDDFEAGEYHPAFGYRHNLDAQWMMGVGGQFKIFKRKEPDDQVLGRSLALWTLYHEALYSLRLDHPTYLFFGPKLLYLLPTRAAKLPLVRDDTLQIEIGAGLSLVLARLISERTMLTIRADRWRGTRTMRLHGLEVAIGLSRAL